MSALEADYSPYKGWVRSATKQDLIDLAPRLREADKDEFIANTGLPAEIGLPEASLAGTLSIGVVESDVAEMVAGTYPIHGSYRAGVVWMVSSSAIEKYPQRFAPASKLVLERMHDEYDLLVNFIDERNTRHLTWLKWLGFHMVRRIDKYGPFSLPFIEFASYKCAYH